MSIPTEATEVVARAIWEATGHRGSDWIYMAPEIPRKQRYMSYATAALTAAAPYIQAAAVAEALEKLAVSFEATASWASYIGTEDIMETWLNAAQRARKAIEASK